jgi:hypothetical protein
MSLMGQKLRFQGCSAPLRHSLQHPGKQSIQGGAAWLLSANSGLLRCSKGLFDHLVGKREQLVGNYQTKRPRGLEIEHQIELGRLLDRNIAWFGST